MSKIDYSKIADVLVDYSIAVKPGEKVLISTSILGKHLAQELIEKVYNVGGIPYIELYDEIILAEILKGSTDEYCEDLRPIFLKRYEKVDSVIKIFSYSNMFELSSAPEDKINSYSKHFSKFVSEYIVKNKKWCLLNYPTTAMAQKADMSTNKFEEFMFKVCTIDYKKLSNAMDGLIKRMKESEKIRIIAKDTDISFSIKNIPIAKCDGKMNLPGGEVFTAPIRDSVNGKITYNTPSMYHGSYFDNIMFEFKDGKIINAKANNSESLNKLLDTDEGARYIGEFAFGLNPEINKPMVDTLFDEKIFGSIHLTPGSSYDECPNGNKSAIHWDLVLILTPEFGGGEIWFDDTLILKDGMFVPDDLKNLNPENFKTTEKITK